LNITNRVPFTVDVASYQFGDKISRIEVIIEVGEAMD